MKKKVALLLFALSALLLFAAVSPPYFKSEIELRTDDGASEKAVIRTDLTHALRAKRAGGYLALYERMLKKYDAKDALNYLGIGLGDYLSAECERRRIDPLDATIEWTQKLSCPFIYYKERSGRAMDLAEAGRSVARAMDEGTGAHARLHTHEVAPSQTEKDLRSSTVEIGRFTTDFSTSGENRRHNLFLAAKAISGTVLAAGESFSFNGTVGARSAERGFREANIVVNGEFVKGVGGGVCQVSTTLYNAVLLAGLPVECAAAHSRPVSYVPYSRDCTVSSATDFRFRNDTSHPIYIAAALKGNSLTFLLYGEKKPGRRRLESEVVEILPYFDRYEDGTLLPVGAKAELLSPGREGVRSRLYLILEESGDALRTLIRENLYPAKDALYRPIPAASAPSRDGQEPAKD